MMFSRFFSFGLPELIMAVISLLILAILVLVIIALIKYIRSK